MFNAIFILCLLVFIVWRVYSLRKHHVNDPKSNNDPASDNYDHQADDWSDSGGDSDSD